MRTLLLPLIILLLASLALAQTFPYPSSSMATTDDALATIANPAWLGVRPGADLGLYFPYTDSTSGEDWGLHLKLGGLGFAGEFVNNEAAFYNRYTLGLGFKTARGVYLGFSHSWWRVLDWEGSWNLGLGLRPLPYVSFGATVLDLNQPRHGSVELNPSYGLALALRPLGSNRLTLSGDLLFTKTAAHKYGEELDPVLRLEGVPIDGLRLTGEYHTDSKFFGAGLSLAVDNLSLGNFSLFNKNSDHQNSVGYLHLISGRYPNFASPKKHQMVEITLGGEIRESEPPFSFFGMGGGKTLHQLRREIEHYADDPRVDGLLITFQGLDIGLAQAQELRRALEDFKATGKRLIAFSEEFAQKDYYLATVCDEIYLLPVGWVDLRGIAASMGYWKGTLNKLGIGVQVVRVRDYKTAANSFIFEETPKEEEEMINWLLDDIYDNLCRRIGEGRNFTMDEVKAKMDAGPYDTRRALEAGLVDSLAYYDQLTERLKDDKFILVTERKYWQLKEYFDDWPDTRTPRVAVIYAEGAIVSGESGESFFSGAYMGSGTIAKAIRKAREDKTIDAIILRVDSPGGSGVASDVIYREVKRTTTDPKNRKPIIVSMGNVAGSGGYYISCAADTIIAEASTITGSIGVIFLKPNLEGLHDKIGFTSEAFRRGQHADAFSLSRPLTEEEMQMMGDAIEQFYDDFIAKVAEGRGLTKSAVDSLGEGRVWTGNQAVQNGLADLVGGMDLAYEVTRGQLGLEEGASLDLEFFPKPHGLFASIAFKVMTLSRPPLPNALQEALEPISLAMQFHPGEPLLLMPYKIEAK